MEKIFILTFLIVGIMVVCNHCNFSSNTKATLTVIQLLLLILQIYYLINLL